LNGVINSVSALGSVENTSSVVLPWLSIAADGERHGFERLVHRVLVSRDGDDLANVNSRAASVGSTTSITSSVRVAAVGVEAVSLNPAESFTRVSSVASSIRSIAINNLLRRSIGDSTSGNEIRGFGFLNGGEGPARTALSLVLDWGGLTSGNPVDGTSWGLQLGLRGVGLQRLLSTNTKDGSELFKRPVGELCVSEGSAWAVLVGFGDLGSGDEEVVELSLKFSVRSVGSVPVLVVLLEGSIVGETFRSFVVGTKCQDGEGQTQEQ